MLPLILKSSACLAVFMLFYKLFLEKESFHKFKRGYLLGVLILSVLIPLITFTTYVEVAPLEIPVYTSEIATPPYVPEHMLEEPINYWPTILWSIYGMGVLVFTIRFGMNLTHIIKRIKQNPKFKNQSLFHVLLTDLVPPHTFLNYIFFNKEKYEAHAIPKEVLIHEETHAKEKHALDILFIEILQIIFWFNPLLYFIKKDIKLNHEFLADQAVINNGIELKNYQNTLLAFSSHAKEPQLANAINYSSIKKRFTVMKTHTSKHIIWVRSLVLLPLLAILVYSFSNNKEVVKEIATTKPSDIPNPIELYLNENGKLFYNDSEILIEDISTIRALENDISVNVNTSLDTDITMTKSITQKIQKHLYNQGLKTFNVCFKAERDLVIMVQVNSVSINAKNSSIKTFKDDLNTVTRNWTNEDFEKVLPILKIASCTEEFINELDAEYKKTDFYNFSRKNLINNSYQKGASKEQIAEYNKLAKYYNSQKDSNYNIKLSDMKRIKYLYELMTEKQKKQAEPFPNFPAPPPAPASTKVVLAPPPPPPPVPANATSEQKEKYKKVSEEYYKKYKVENGKVSEKAPPPPPPIPANATPEQKEKYKRVREEYYKKYKVENGKVSEQIPPPPPPLDMDKLAKENAVFYYEGKKVSSDEALKIYKANKDLNIQVHEYGSKQPIVKMSKEPIRLKKK